MRSKSFLATLTGVVTRAAAFINLDSQLAFTRMPEAMNQLAFP